VAYFLGVGRAVFATSLALRKALTAGVRMLAEIRGYGCRGVCEGARSQKDDSIRNAGGVCRLILGQCQVVNRPRKKAGNIEQ